MLRRLIPTQFLAAGADCARCFAEGKRERGFPGSFSKETVSKIEMCKAAMQAFAAQDLQIKPVYPGCRMAVDVDLPCWHMECPSQKVLKIFVFILIVQVEYIGGLSGDPDGVQNITSTFPGKNQGYRLVEFALWVVPCLFEEDPVQAGGTRRLFPLSELFIMVNLLLFQLL